MNYPVIDFFLVFIAIALLTFWLYKCLGNYDEEFNELQKLAEWGGDDTKHTEET